MISDLYQKTILKYAADATAHGAMENADVSLTHHNPMCGDRITVYINVKDKKLTDFNHDAKACALCQASASLLGEHYHGLNKQALSQLIDAIKTSLNDGVDEINIWPDKKWQSLDIFNVVREHKSRRTCVTLPFDALLLAFGQID